MVTPNTQSWQANKNPRKKINLSLKRQIAKTLAQTVTDLKDLDETHTFFSDFLTESEYEAFAKRLAIAYWLRKGRSYSNIKQNLKVSSATIATVQSTRKTEGFQLALKKIEAEEWANIWSERIRKFVRR
jgi:TrpR-related protein YerC/YecD